ncbi:MAG TPA: hypothetical protein VLC08_16170, partial [Chitinolyticbacter sp.]|nr:hypothetical protein [Chitinolyticbacter sp.]
MLKIKTKASGKHKLTFIDFKTYTPNPEQQQATHQLIAKPDNTHIGFGTIGNSMPFNESGIQTAPKRVYKIEFWGHPSGELPSPTPKTGTTQQGEQKRVNNAAYFKQAPK